MNHDRFQGQWAQFQGRAREQWGRLTVEDLAVVAGQREQLVRRLGVLYGIEFQEAEQQIRRWIRCAEHQARGSRLRT
ncbi:general stress protein CsbD [Roseateles sp.]|uniref:general stress protein CsbD n=1 Tax=Roseateles sp. TaxID=1971397 RepID=UPI003265BEDA